MIWVKVLVASCAIWAFPLGLCVLGVLDELVMPVVRRRVRAWQIGRAHV